MYKRNGKLQELAAKYSLKKLVEMCLFLEMKTKEWNSNESLKSNILYKDTFIRGELYCLSKQFSFVIELNLNMYNIVSQSNTSIMWHKFYSLMWNKIRIIKF